MKWTRVISIQDFVEGKANVFKFALDIKDGLQESETIDVTKLPRVTARFDPYFWEANNPMGHPEEVYTLNKEQLRL